MKSYLQRIIAATVKPLLVGLLVVGLTSCGGSTSNDFGVSFTLLGFYPAGEEFEAPECGSTPTQSIVGLSVPLSIRQGSTPGEGTGVGEFFGGSIFAYVGLQNAQTGVALLTEQARVSYSIPGSGVSIPNNSYPLNIVLGPADFSSGSGDQGGDTGEDGEDSEGDSSGVERPESSLPESFRNLCNVGYSQIPIVSSDIREFLSLNRGSLPELPFLMNVTVTATAVSTAGDFLESNSRTISVEVVSDTGFNPAG